MGSLMTKETASEKFAVKKWERKKTYEKKLSIAKGCGKGDRIPKGRKLEGGKETTVNFNNGGHGGNNSLGAAGGEGKGKKDRGFTKKNPQNF